jgi:hypothetical protein
MARPPRQRLAALQLAGFQVSITGRFWVSTEGVANSARPTEQARRIARAFAQAEIEHRIVSLPDQGLLIHMNHCDVAVGKKMQAP